MIAFNSYVRQFKTFRKDAVKPSESLALRGGNVKEGILGRKFSNRRYNGALQKELSDFNLTVRDRTDELLKLDAIQYTNLGTDSTKTEKKEVKADKELWKTE